VTDFKKRVLTALVMGPIILALFGLLPAAPFLAFVVLVLLLCIYELTSMAGSKKFIVIFILSAASLTPLYFEYYNLYLLWLVCAPAVLLILRLGPSATPETSVNRALGMEIVILFVSQVFLAFPLFSLYRLKTLGIYYPLILLMIIWASDTAAYLVGKSLGRHKLAPAVSPKKTVEGFVGAIAGAVLITLVFHKAIDLTIMSALYSGIILGILGQLGDMLESVAKRVFGVKDSSGLFPGHGGILDRLDSFLLTAPFLYHYVSGMWR
jgi:phosphatidate cytidylyltransferase